MKEDPESQQRVQKIMDFRQSIVAELANPYMDQGNLKKLIREKAAISYEMPWSEKNSISPGTIHKWLESYRHKGKEGLRPKRRSDRGKSRAISESDEILFTEFLRANPQLTATIAWKKLYDEGKLESQITASTLSRIVIAHRLEREQRLADQVLEKCLKFEFFYPLECVQADCLHGPLIPDGKKGQVKAILIAFIDDATRRIVYAEFTASEHSLAFEKGIRHILASQGNIGKIYVDNGSTFVSNQTQRILDTLQIQLIHSTPHRPQGRGKIERFFRTVRDSFLRPLDIQSVTGFDDINLRFRTWLEAEYHRTPHSSLADRKTPLECWIEKARHLKPINQQLDLDSVFFHECCRRVAGDNTVTINSVLYEVPAILSRKRITLRFNPHQCSTKVQAWFDGKNYGDCRQVDSYANTKVKRSNISKDVLQDKSISSSSHIQAGLTAAASHGVQP